MARQQLPPQIKKIEVADRKTGKTVVRYRLAASAGVNAETGKRQQVLRHYPTEREARAALAEITDAATKGLFVPRRAITVREVCETYVAGRHKLRATSKAKLTYDLAPLVERHGDEPVQRLTKGHIDALVADLLAGGMRTAAGRTRRPWGPIAVNKSIQTIRMVLEDAQRHGAVARNVAAHVDLVAVSHRAVDTYTEAEVQTLLRSAAGDRLVHAWELALCGLRRGELAGLRWADVDLQEKTVSIVNNRVEAGGQAVENDPKSATSRRTLPLPDRLVEVLKTARARQAAEHLASGGRWRLVGVRRVQRGGPAVSPDRGEPVLAGRGHGGRFAADQAARRKAHCGDAYALGRGACGGDRRVDRAQGRQLDDAAVCALAG